ncbi:hypothetical protein [Burkholderia plantarii]|nr:hypothetical protein [Burkholderia plantarii]
MCRTFEQFDPVSYTHLDVYKRQHVPHVRTVRPCLLYTSRCV